MNILSTKIRCVYPVFWEIKTQYSQEQQILDPALVCALLLNHPHVPSLYATSPKGYGKLQAKYQQDCQQYLVEELLTWAIEKVRSLNQPPSLNQDLLANRNWAWKKIGAESCPKIEEEEHPKLENPALNGILATLSLTNIVEQAVIYETNSHLQSDYASSYDLIDLSDACALVLNHQNVPTLYATNAEEYNHYRHTYFTEYQTQVRSIIRRIISQINLEGSKYCFLQNTMAKSNANRRNIDSWNNSVQ